MYALVVFVFLFCSAQCQAPATLYEKKSGDLSEFTSAMNGASRLRYGKRSGALFFDTLRDMDQAFDNDNDFQFMEKRVPSPDFIVSHLNKAERLRFGKK